MARSHQPDLEAADAGEESRDLQALVSYHELPPNRSRSMGAPR
jgi:hypothetical protein